MSCIWTDARHGGCSKIKMLAGAGARWLVDRLEWTPLPVVSRRPGLSCAVARMRNRTAIPVSDNPHPRCHCAINTISVTVSAGRTKVIELRQQGCEIMLDAAALNFLLFILARGPGSAGPSKVDAACQPSQVTGLVPLTVPGSSVAATTVLRHHALLLPSLVRTLDQAPRLMDGSAVAQ